MTRLCPCCGFPAQPALISFGRFNDKALVMGFCRRCVAANERLPLSTEQKRTNAAAARAAANPGRYFAAILPDLGAAQLAAGLLAHPVHAEDAARALGWIDEKSRV
ncbi:hypothetical protein AZOA_47980 [Azoarcus sp. Aa7]|nr:hypothetical protein [Azoarcus sp. Aa7]